MKYRSQVIRGGGVGGDGLSHFERERERERALKRPKQNPKQKKLSMIF
jgi:hypothetical protein